MQSLDSYSQWFVSTKSAASMLGFGVFPAGNDSAEHIFLRISPEQPRLSGQHTEGFYLSEGQLSTSGSLQLLGNSQVLIGAGKVPVQTKNLEASAYSLYREILEAVGNRHLYRIWNFVPGINHIEKPHIENYRLFCCGRARAFKAHSKSGQPLRLPAASATGSMGKDLLVVFLCGKPPGEDWENPEQVPAYRYPVEYGPSRPSFSRATRVRGLGGNWIFISGTAAIKGSLTCFPGDFSRQVDVTLENVDLMLRGAGTRLGMPDSGQRRHFRIYLRHSENLEPLLQRLRGDVLTDRDTWIVVRADICRRDLEVEMEVMLYPEG